MSAPAPPSPSSLDRIALMQDPLPVHLVYPHARFYPARLRRFIEAMRRSVPMVLEGAARRG